MGHGIYRAIGRRHGLGFIAADNPVMVVAVGLAELDVVVVDMAANRRQLPQIHRRARDGDDVAVRQGFGIAFREEIAEQLDFLVEDGTAAAAVQVEIGMVRQVAYRIGVADSFVADGKGVIVRQIIPDSDLKGAGIIPFSVRARIGQFQPFCRFFGLPELFIEAGQGAAVQVIASVVALQLIVFAADVQTAPGNAVAAAADESSDIFVFAHIGFDVVIAQDDVDLSPVGVLRPQSLDMAAVRADGQGRAVSVGQGIEKDGPAVGQAAEIFFRNNTHGIHSSFDFLRTCSRAHLVLK